MLQDEAAMVEQEWFLGEWFSDAIQSIQQERVFGSEARIAARTQVWLDENRSRWREISRHEEVPVERGRRRSCPPCGVSRLQPRRCHSVSPERTKRISIAVLPVLDVNQLTKNYVPRHFGGLVEFALDVSRIRGTRRLPPCLTREAGLFGDRYNTEWSKEGKNGCTCLIFSMWSRPTGGLGSTDEF